MPKYRVTVSALSIVFTDVDVEAVDENEARALARTVTRTDPGQHQWDNVGEFREDSFIAEEVRQLASRDDEDGAEGLFGNR